MQPLEIGVRDPAFHRLEYGVALELRSAALNGDEKGERVPRLQLAR